MSKYLLHFKNEDKDLAVSVFTTAPSFTEAYAFAQNKVIDLDKAKGSGWRVIGVYEILYNIEQYSHFIH